MEKPRLLRITTVPISLHLLLNGQLDFMQRQGFDLLAVSASGPEVHEITNQGIAHTAVSFTRKITPFRDLVSLLQLIAVIKRFRPDIVHSHTPKAGLLGMLAAWICRIPIRMHTIAGLPMLEAVGIRKSILKMAEQITIRCSTSVFPNSRGLYDYLLNEFDINRKSSLGSKFKIIGKGSTNGVDLGHFQRTDYLKNLGAEIRTNYGVGQSDCVYCFVGRIVGDKGIVELVNSFASIARNNEQAWLMLVGHFEDDLDPLPKNIKTLIAEHPRIIHPGFQHDVRPWIIASDVFVLPSYREGFPNVVLQAGSLEKPCIVSDINGCNEIIHQQRTGLIVPPKNVAALTEAMIYLLKNDKIGYKMGVESRKWIAAHFDQSYIWNELLLEYQKQLAFCI